MLTIEGLIGDAIQELKRMRVEEGPSNENRAAQWYLGQAQEILDPNANSSVTPNSPNVPTVAEETTVGKQEDEPSEEGTAPFEEDEKTEGIESSKGEESSTPAPVTGTVTGIFENDPSGN